MLYFEEEEKDWNYLDYYSSKVLKMMYDLRWDERKSISEKNLQTVESFIVIIDTDSKDDVFKKNVSLIKRI